GPARHPGLGAHAHAGPGRALREPVRGARSGTRDRPARPVGQPDRRLGLRPPRDRRERSLMPDGAPLVELRDVRIEYRPRGSTAHRTIISGVDLEVADGETIGIVGESGSGKSMLAKALIRLLPRDVMASGRIAYRGSDVNALSERRMETLRGSGIS